MHQLSKNHPGWILYTKFMEPANISQKELAEIVAYSLEELADLISGRVPMTARLAIRLTKIFNKTAKFWLDLQNNYDIELELKLSENENEKKNL